MRATGLGFRIPTAKVPQDRSSTRIESDFCSSIVTVRQISPFENVQGRVEPRASNLPEFVNPQDLLLQVSAAIPFSSLSHSHLQDISFASTPSQQLEGNYSSVSNFVLDEVD